MKPNKIGFFKKYTLAILEQKMFPYILKEKFLSAVGFFVKMILLFSTIFAVVMTGRVFDAFPGYIDTLEKKLPEYSIVDGKIALQEAASFKLNEAIYVTTVPDGGEYSVSQTFEDTGKNYYVYAFILKDGIDVYATDRSEVGLQRIVRVIPTAADPASKSLLINSIKNFSESYLARLFVMCGFIIIFFILYGIYRFFQLLLYAFSVFFLNIIFINKLRIRDYFKIAIYVSPLPVLLEAFALIIAGGVPEVATFINMLIAMFYVFYALRAIKLDNILTTAIGNTPEEKIKNAIMHAQEELEKQIEDMDQKEQEMQEAKDKLKESSEKLSQADNDDNSLEEKKEENPLKDDNNDEDKK